LMQEQWQNKNSKQFNKFYSLNSSVISK